MLGRRRPRPQAPPISPIYSDPDSLPRPHHPTIMEPEYYSDPPALAAAAAEKAETEKAAAPSLSGSADKAEAPSLSTEKAATEKAEALKRNTDCVYFLASPLTCKKGSECEFRHSDGARMNPRDCWYWLNGSCLNPKCSFRHPPLDAFFGTPSSGAASGNPPVAPPKTTSVAQMPAAAVHAKATSHVASKQSVPCYYFQQGYCMKGDKCPFLHGPQSSANTAPALPAQPSKFVATIDKSAQLPTQVAVSLQKCTSQQEFSQTNIPRMKAETEPVSRPAVKRSSPPTLFQNLPASPKYINDITGNGNSGGNLQSHLPQLSDDHLSSNGLEAGEILRESSPGFDVLVDDGLKDSEYYHDGEEFVHNSGHGGRHLSSVNEYEYHRSLDLDAVTEFEIEPYNLYGGVLARDALNWEQNKHRSSGRALERLSTQEKRGSRRPRSPDQISRSDLRYQLSKQRKVDGPHSARSPDRDDNYYRRDRGQHAEDHRRQHSEDHRKPHAEDRRSGFRTFRDQHLLPRRSNISSRLQGRLQLPESVNSMNNRSDKGTERGIDQRRVSPTQPILSEQGRHLNGRIRQPQEEVAGRNKRGSSLRRDEMDTVNFAGPKSLAELKGTKVSDRSEDRAAKGNTTGVRSGKVVGSQESDDFLPFEGPKPLSEILKRKRGAASANGSEYTTDEGSNQMAGLPSDSNKKASEAFANSEEPEVSVNQTGSLPENEGLISTAQEEAKGTEFEVDDDEAYAEGQGEEYEYYEEGDEEYEYEGTETGEGDQAEHEDGDQAEYENVDAENDYLEEEEEEEEDDFASKIKAIIR